METATFLFDLFTVRCCDSYEELGVVFVLCDHLYLVTALEFHLIEEGASTSVLWSPGPPCSFSVSVWLVYYMCFSLKLSMPTLQGGRGEAMVSITSRTSVSF